LFDNQAYQLYTSDEISWWIKCKKE
jgi:hypothetical protein